LLPRIANDLSQRKLQDPAGRDRQQTDGGNESHGPQYEMSDDLALYLDLLSPSPIERCELLLGSQAIIQDSLNILPNSHLLQAVDPIRTGFSRGFVGVACFLCLEPCLIACQSGHIGLGQLLSLRDESFPVAKRPPSR